jgi:hypothetical protein
MKRIKKLIVPAALFAIAGVSGCNGDGSYQTGMPVIDRWVSPGSNMEAGTLEYVDSPQNNRPPPVPAPDLPSELIRPDAARTKDARPRLNLPALPGTSEVSAPALYGPYEANDDPFFEDEAGYTPMPGQ